MNTRTKDWLRKNAVYVIIGTAIIAYAGYCFGKWLHTVTQVSVEVTS